MPMVREDGRQRRRCLSLPVRGMAMRTSTAARGAAFAAHFLWQPLATPVTALLGLCTFLGIGLAATPNVVCTRAVLNQRVESSDVPALEALAAEIGSDASLLATLEKAAPSAVSPAPGEPFSLADYLADRGADVEVRPRVGAQGATVEIMVTPGTMPSGEAAAWSNALARRGGDALRQWAQAQRTAEHQQALALERRARQELQAARTRLDAFVQNHLKQLDAQLAAAEAAQAAEAAPPPSLPPVPPEVLAARARLAAELAETRQRRAQLLLDRTPLHPDVRQLDEEVARLESDLQAATPAEPAPPPRREPAPSQAAGARGVQSRELAERYQELSQAVEEATVAVEQSGENERIAWQEAQRPPQVTLELASEPEPMARQPKTAVASTLPPTSSDTSGWLILLAMGAISVGAGIFWMGASPRPVLVHVSEIEAALQLPVLAEVPVTTPAAPRPWYRRFQLRPWSLGAGSVCVLAALIALTLWAV